MDEKKISLKLKHISQSYIVDNKVFDAVVDVSLDVYKLIREQSASGQRKKQLTIF